MEPLSTYFKISPSLLQPTITPRSDTSSSCFSSPSFAEHQTGYKAYLQSPRSPLGSARQVVDDNPLFEGFNVPPSGGRRDRETGSPGVRLAGNANVKLQEQLHSLLSILQRAEVMQDAIDLQDCTAIPRLADELEAVVNRLREKEQEAECLKQEAHVERRLRAKVHHALGSAEATIQKLRATPTPKRGGGPVSASSRDSPWHPSARSIGSVSFNNPMSSGGGGVAGGALLPRGRRSASLRDSACKQLLQSPSVSSTGARSPIPAVDDGSEHQMASPKELPVDRSFDHFLSFKPASVRSDQLQPTPDGDSPQLQSRARPFTEQATPLGTQPPLYGWMREMLMAATPKPGAAAVAGDAASGSASPARGAHLQTPQPVSGGTLANAVRSVLGSSPAPLVVYGTPLHRRIQRLLAEQRTPPMLQCGHAAAAQASVEAGAAGVTPGTEGSDMLCARARRLTRAHSWSSSSQTETPSDSLGRTETSSSFSSPGEVGNLALLEQRKSVLSPFHPLRERFARGSCAGGVSDGGAPVPQPPGLAAHAGTPTSKELQPADGAAERRCHDSTLGADEIIAQLGLADVAEAADHLQVLELVERWAQEQYIAAKRAMLDNVKPSYNVDGESELGDRCGPDGGGAYHPELDSYHQLVDTAVQTEAVGQQAAQCSRSATALRDVGTAITPRSPTEEPTTCAPVHRKVERESVSCGASMVEEDDMRDTASPARSDQLKPSPTPARLHSMEAEFGPKPSPASPNPRVITPGPARLVGRAAGQSVSTPARRGLFRDAASARKSAGHAATPRAASGVAGRARSHTQACNPGTEASAPNARPAVKVYPPVREIEPYVSPAGPVTQRASASQNPAVHPAELHAENLKPPRRSAVACDAAPRNSRPVPPRPPATTCGAVFSVQSPRLILASPGVPLRPVPAALVPYLERIQPEIDWRSGATEHTATASAPHGPATDREAHAAPHILMTPGNAMAGNRKSLGRRFFLSGERNSHDSGSGIDVRSGGDSQGKLSSISTVSIIRSELDDDIVVGQPGPGSTRPISHNTPRPKIKRPFFGFLASLSSCSRAPDAF